MVLSKRSYKYFEYTTPDYAKGYVFAASKRTALKNLKRKNITHLPKLLSYYGKGRKERSR